MMPAPYETGIPGGTNVNLTQAVGFTQDLGGTLTTPGRQERPREERLNQLRSLILSAGQAVVGAVEGEARLAAIAQRKAEERRREALRLYEWVTTRREAEDDAKAAAYRKAMKERLAGVEQTQFQIMRDPRSENNEWVMNEAVLRQNNAQYPEEKQAWNDFILRHQEAARRDARVSAEKAARVANAELISDTRIAAKTAKNVIDDLANDVQMDADLRKRLIGNGIGINERVNEYVLQVAMSAAPQLFDLNKKDPMYAEKLEQQTILLDQLEQRAQTTIVNRLTQEHIANVEKAMEVAGADRIDVAAQAFAEGDMTASEYHDIVGDTLRTQFAHVDPRQRDTIRERLYRQQFDRLAQLLDQPNPGKALERMESLLAVADLNANERQIIREQIISDKFPKAVRERLERSFQQKMAEMSGITRLNDGRTIVPRDPRLIQAEMLENGSYRDIAGQMLDELGIEGDPSKLSPLKANLLAEITQVTLAAEEDARRELDKVQRSVDRTARFLSGAALSTDEANDQWSEGILMRALSGTLSADDPVMQNILQQYRKNTGKDLQWSGGPIPVNAETLPVLRDVALQEGQAWGRNSIVSMPRTMATTLENMVLYESPEKAEIALNFWMGLGPEGQERLGSSLSARAQMVLMEANRLYGQDSRTAAGLSMTEIANRVRTIDQNTAVAALRLARDQAGLSDLMPNPQFRYEYAKALSKALGRDILQDEYGAQIPGFEFDVPGAGLFDATGGGALQGLSQSLGDRAALMPLFAQMAVVALSNPGISTDEAAVIVAARMREQGYKVVSGVQGPAIIRDPFGHFPTDVTPAKILQDNLSVPRTTAQAKSFIASLPNVGPQTQAMARDGVSFGDILWSYLSEQAGPGVPVPHYREWAFMPETNGSLFTNLIAQENGGVPMHVAIPGRNGGRLQMLLDVEGNPLLVVSSKRRPVVPQPIDRTRIPDYFLTKDARRKVKIKPDSAERMTELLRYHYDHAQNINAILGVPSP